MGRTREYDEDLALTGAMEAFRRKGYAAVSIKDLEDATGLAGGSIYNSYGDKAGVYSAAFVHYNETVVRARIARYAPQSAGLAGLRRLFLTLLEEPGGGSYGCLITNSAIEFGGGSSAPPGAAEGLQILSNAFQERLNAAAANKSVGGSRLKALGAKLLALYQGILVLVRAGWDKRDLKALINDEFSEIERRLK
jgi:TetR/AcrR family transcriptional regulator, transcriptional repressor for nem operon